jgi:hypothetical protein
VSDAPDRPPRVTNHSTRAMEDEPPPILGTWRRIYIVVLCYLAFLILALYLFGRAVRP